MRGLKNLTARKNGSLKPSEANYRSLEAVLLAVTSSGNGTLARASSEMADQLVLGTFLFQL